MTNVTNLEEERTNQAEMDLKSPQDDPLKVERDNLVKEFELFERTGIRELSTTNYTIRRMERDEDLTQRKL